MIRPSRSILLLCALAASGCRGAGEVESLLGTWSGALDCAAEVDDGGQTVTLEYTTALVLDLVDQDDKTYGGTLESTQTYTWQGSDIETVTLYDVVLFQARPQGSQPVDLQEASCASYAVWVDGEERDAVCALADDAEYPEGEEPDTAAPPPTGDLRWDGADTIDLTGSLCAGSISR